MDELGADAEVVTARLLACVEFFCCFCIRAFLRALASSSRILLASSAGARGALCLSGGTERSTKLRRWL